MYFDVLHRKILFINLKILYFTTAINGFFGYQNVYNHSNFERNPWKDLYLKYCNIITAPVLRDNVEVFIKAM